MEAFDDEDVSASEDDVELEGVSDMSEDADLPLKAVHEDKEVGKTDGRKEPPTAMPGLAAAASEVDAIMAGEVTGDAAILNLEASSTDVLTR
jgi:hypothetical protein